MLYSEEREIVLNACREMVSSNLTVGSWGNISLRAKDGNIVITPSGTNYNKSNAEDMVITDIDGKVIDGKLKPSSERLMHYEIYKNRADVMAIVHTHSIYSSVLAVTGDGIPPVTEDTAMLLGNRVNVSRYALTGTMELARYVVEGLELNNATIMKNHGAVSVGTDMERAIIASQVLEKSARIFVTAKMIGEVNILPPEDVKKLREMSEGYLNQWKNWK
ncbi:MULTISPECIES: class II aldolase/adducin family protein [Ferroplasma]|uniref:L-fuculose phosphate aldolase n=1 Tax=Ferroplasma acidarmanus Fer1 TaxID=333146 RepID=S0AML2_FERAC|nr:MULTISPECIES: class II aldolase/adducin family protein [Ferroplasma]AGO60236.1 L-fuculose phosphate aldolase [Ferroplasma acidarmanus Fer1]MCL4349124.1 class II aldolase/adducin family protein [Candidatus Thermoplasmatota archaeon]WMT53988.1 MAG: class II aldolase/adducin family protein [Ferroplasma acidiphilum]